MMIGWKIRGKNAALSLILSLCKNCIIPGFYLISDPVKRCGAMYFRSDDEIGFGSESLTS